MGENVWTNQFGWDLFWGHFMHNQVEVSSEIVKHRVKGDSLCVENGACCTMDEQSFVERD